MEMCIAELKAAAIQGGVRNIFTSPFTLRDSLETLLSRYAFRLSPDKRQWMTHTNRNEKCTKNHP
jgi:hypothetical protein